MIIKKWNGSSFDELYPKTKASEIYAADGVTGIFDANLKIKVDYLPDAAFGGFNYVGEINGAGQSPADLVPTIITQETSGYKANGIFWTIGSSGATVIGTSELVATDNKYYAFTFPANEENGPVNNATLEIDDWLIVIGIDRSTAGTELDPYIVQLGVNNNTYKSATSTSAGIVKLASNTAQSTSANSVTTTANRTYAIQNNGSGQLVVNVPWVDTNTTYAQANSSTLGLIKLGSDTAQTVAANSVTATANRSYALQVNADGQGVVNVPWTDTNTTYSAGEGLTLTGTTFRETFPVYVQADAPTTTVTNAIWFDI